MNETPVFISLKDHKQDFENHPKCRLIKPAKSQLGKISKSILDNINNEVRAHTHVNQWLNPLKTNKENRLFPLTS